MMNKELLSPKDIVIANLKVKVKSLERQISEFKKYDEKRKDYYKFLVEDWQNNDAQHIIEGLRSTVKKQAKEIKSLQTASNRYKMLMRYSEEELEGILQNFNKVQYSDTVRALNDKNKKLKKENERLFAEIIQLKNQTTS